MKFKVNSSSTVRPRTYIVTVDEQDAYLLRGQAWIPQRSDGDNVYFIRCLQGGVRTSLHRTIMDADSTEVVRFKNGDTLDLRRANLIKDKAPVARAAVARSNCYTATLCRMALAA